MVEALQTGTREWSDHSENCILGCSNDCRYCYAKANAIRFGREAADTWKVEHPNYNRKPAKHKGVTMFPTSHDLHMEHVEWWGQYLIKLLEKGNKVLIVSKPEYKAISAICDQFYQSSYQDQIEFRFTIGTNDDTVAAYWEPGAPSPSERLLSIAKTTTLGFKTSISMEPLMMEDPKPVIDILLIPYVKGEIWIGTMNHYQLNPEVPEEARQIKIQSKENIERVYNSLKDNPRIRWKDSIQKMLGIDKFGVKI